MSLGCSRLRLFKLCADAAGLSGRCCSGLDPPEVGPLPSDLLHQSPSSPSRQQRTVQVVYLNLTLHRFSLPLRVSAAVTKEFPQSGTNPRL